MFSPGLHVFPYHSYLSQGPPRKPRPKLGPYLKDSAPAMKTVDDSVPAKKSVNLAVSDSSRTPSSIYEKDINPYAKAATATAMDAVGMHIVCVEYTLS